MAEYNRAAAYDQNIKLLLIGDSGKSALTAIDH